MVVMAGKKNIKPGVQYSHYTGTNRQNVVCSIALANEYMQEGNIEEAMVWLKEAQKEMTDLSILIAELDIINKFE